MGAGDVYPAEMPNHPTNPIAPLDDDTADRLLAGRLDPGDAPPAYTEVAKLLRAAAGPACPDELAGQAAALAAFRTAHRRPAPVRGRLVAVSLAGVLAAGGVWVAAGAGTGGLWTTERPPTLGPVRSPTGGPDGGGSGPGAAGLLRPASPGPTTAAGSGRGTVTGVRPPSARDRATARHGGGVTSRGGGSTHGVKPAKPKEPKEPKEPKAKGPKAKASEAEEPRVNGAEAEPGEGGNRAGGKRK